MDSKTAAKQAFMPLMRELVRTYQAFADCDARGHRESGLTTAQADVIFSLGNRGSLTFKEIGERTLITKGTLTGIVDRLEAKGFVERIADSDDRRCTQVRLTKAGHALFETRFPAHVAYMKARFDKLTRQEQSDVLVALQKLRGVF